VRPVEPPRWTTEEFNEQRDRAQRIFCNQRLNESLEAYTETFEECLAYVNELLDVTGELLDLESSADGARDKSNLATC